MTDIEDLSIEDKIHEFTREELGPDELYDLRKEMADSGEESLATRVDIEYRNSLRYDDYWPAFTAGNLVSMLVILGQIQYYHVAHGNRSRADIAEDLADTIADNFYEWAGRMDVDLREYLGIEIPEEDPEDRDHTKRMKRAKHDRDAETISAEAEPGGLDEDDPDLDFGPDAVEKKEIHPSPGEPDTPGGDGGDDPTPG